MLLVLHSWQVSLEVRTTVIISPLAGTYAYVALLAPTAVAPLYHWYVGVTPPLVGVAVNVTVAPVHIGLTSGIIVTLTGSIGLTVIVTAFEVAGLPLVHVSFEVRITVIISPLVGTYAYVALLVPTAVAPLYHWYVGANPPFVGVAVKVTVAPEHTGVISGAIITLTGRTAPT